MSSRWKRIRHVKIVLRGSDRLFMKIKVKFFSILREVFGAEEKEVELRSRSNILDLLNTLCDSPQRRETIFGDSSEPKTYIQIFKNGKPVQSLDGIHTKLGEGDTVSIFPAIFGG